MPGEVSLDYEAEYNNRARTEHVEVAGAIGGGGGRVRLRCSLPSHSTLSPDALAIDRTSTPSPATSSTPAAASVCTISTRATATRSSCSTATRPGRSTTAISCAACATATAASSPITSAAGCPTSRTRIATSTRSSSRVDDLTALLDHLKIDRDVTLVLHDWGGMIGMAWAARFPERVKRLVVLNTAAFHLPRRSGCRCRCGSAATRSSGRC